MPSPRVPQTDQSELSGVAVIAAVVSAFVVADQFGGSGFIACFTAGLDYGEVTPEAPEGAAKAPHQAFAMRWIQISFLVIGCVLLGNLAIGNIT